MQTGLIECDEKRPVRQNEAYRVTGARGMQSKRSQWCECDE